MSEQNKMISGKEEKQKMVVGSFYNEFNQDGSFYFGKLKLAEIHENNGHPLLIFSWNNKEIVRQISDTLQYKVADQ